MSDRIAFEKWFGAPAHGLDRLGDGYRLSSAHSAWGAWQGGVAAERAKWRAIAEHVANELEALDDETAQMQAKSLREWLK